MVRTLLIHGVTTFMRLQYRTRSRKDTLTVNSDLVVTHFFRCSSRMLTAIWLQKRKVRLESEKPGDWLGPSDQRQVETPAPATYVYNFLSARIVVSNRVD